MRRYLLLLAFFSFLADGYGQLRKNSLYQQYIDKYKNVAVQQMKKYKIPASITLAQGLLESGAGRSHLALKGNNHFGIKCHGWKGGKMYKDDDYRNECFRTYDSAYESYEDHSKFLVNGSRYKKLFTLRMTDYKGWAKGLKKAGYATNPQYSSKLIEIIELYDLHKFDRVKGGASFDLSMGHTLYSFNKNYYVIADDGDSFYSIAKEFGKSARILAKCNERKAGDKLAKGDIVYLHKKRSKAPKEYKNFYHVVKNNESLYYISQLYGIKLKSLYKLNRLPEDFTLKVGDRLKVR